MRSKGRCSGVKIEGSRSLLVNLLKSWIRPSGESMSGAVMSAVVGGVGVAEVGELLLLEGEKIYIVNDRMTKKQHTFVI